LPKRHFTVHTYYISEPFCLMKQFLLSTWFAACVALEKPQQSPQGPYIPHATAIKHDGLMNSLVRRHDANASSWARITWITSYFSTDDDADRKQHLCAIAKNLIHDQIEKVVILTEDGTVDAETFDDAPEVCRGSTWNQDKSKLVIKHMPHQPTYYDFFHEANTNYSGRKAVIANGDIHLFGQVPTCISREFLQDRKVLALSRMPSPMCQKIGLPPAKPSKHAECATFISGFDAFMFVGPIKDEVMALLKVKRCHESCPTASYSWFMNRLGAELLVADIFQKHSGMQLQNYCHDIKIRHLHCGTPHSGQVEDLWDNEEQGGKFHGGFPEHLEC